LRVGFVRNHTIQQQDNIDVFYIFFDDIKYQILEPRYKCREVEVHKIFFPYYTVFTALRANYSTDIFPLQQSCQFGVIAKGWPISNTKPCHQLAIAYLVDTAPECISKKSLV
jgi:hypothetical protein